MMRPSTRHSRATTSGDIVGKQAADPVVRTRNPEIIVSLSPRKMMTVFLCVSMILVLMHLTTQGIKYSTGHDTLLGVVHQFNLSDENNISTWYASSILLVCSALLALVWLRNRQMQKPYAVHWFGLSIIFLWLSLDEAASLHEMMSPPLHEAFHFNGYFYFAWVIPGMLFVLVVGLSFLRFLAHLPVPTRRLFLAAGFLYVGGALGIEMVENNNYALFGTANTATFFLLVTIEEGLEMLGVVVFLYALCVYLANYAGPTKIVLQARP